MAVVKETFPESTSRIQTHTIEIDKLKEIESITVDGGEVEIESVEDNLVTLRFRARNWDRRVQTGGSYTPADSKYVSNQGSRYYNSGGYSGTLSKYLYSGSYTPSDTKTVTDRTSVSGYKEWHSYDPATKKWVWTHSNGSELFPYPKRYDKDGYVGTFPRTGYNSTHLNVKKYNPPSGTPTASDTYVSYEADIVYYHSTVATRPEVDTRVYRYRGTVRRPARDTRTYAYYYQYSVTINYIEKGFEIQTKIDGQLRTANEGWVKIDGQLRPIEYIYTKIDGQIVEVD